jgi:transposase-like protein
MKITLVEEDRSTLNRWVKSRAVGDKQSLRAKIVLMTADGCSTQDIMHTLKVSNPILNLWRKRFLACGLEGLKRQDAPVPGAAAVH